MSICLATETISIRRDDAAMSRLRADDRHGAYDSLLDELDAEYAVHHAALRPGADWFAVAHDRKLAAMIASLRDVTAPAGEAAAVPATEPAEESTNEPESELERLRAEVARLEAENVQLNHHATALEMRFIMMDQRIAELEDLAGA